MMTFWVMSCFGVAILAPLAVRAGVRGYLWAAFPWAGFIAFAVRILSPSGASGSESTPWIDALSIDLSFRLDGLSGLFALLVLGIGGCIVAYADGYFAHSSGKPRFYGFLFAFMGSMLGLVLADDLITLFVFWELTSITSFLLIGFDHEEEDARRSARQALVVTGMGGLALLGAAIVLHGMVGTFQIDEIVAQGNAIRAHPQYGSLLALILLAAFTKSAQVPFHFWLPAAMAGPTPVSAYLHSATMVKAGVYLLARLHPALGGTDAWSWTLIGVGGVTCAGTSWVSLRQTDLKSMLAYSTTMALGLFVLAFGVGNPELLRAALAYLVVHALYKGALFMAAGSVDHEAGTRDLRQLSGLARRMPVTAAAVVLACASMAGLPPFFGFPAKELLYESSLHAGSPGLWALVFMLLANLALVAVAWVLVAQPFFRARSEIEPGPAVATAHEAPWVMWLGPALLAAAGLGLGIGSVWAERVLIVPAVSAMVPHAHLHGPGALAMWHGLSPALGLGVATIGLGAMLGALARPIRDSKPMAVWYAIVGRIPSVAFERLLAGVVRFSAGSLRLLFPRRLRMSVLVLLGVLLVFPWVAGGNWLAGTPPDSGPPALAEDVIICSFLIISSFVAATTRRPIRAVVALGVSGYAVALIYLFYGAPDLGMTQLSIETLTVLLVALILRHLPRRLDEMERTPGRWRDAVLSGALGFTLGSMLLWVSTATPARNLNAWYLEHSVPEAHGHNVVNVILVDFRAFDTWGEITVFTLAGMGVFALLRERRRDGGEVSNA
jgi:multicomponent Na+:H+ antiporter subunit A